MGVTVDVAVGLIDPLGVGAEEGFTFGKMLSADADEGLKLVDRFDVAEADGVVGVAVTVVADESDARAEGLSLLFAGGLKAADETVGLRGPGGEDGFIVTPVRGGEGEAPDEPDETTFKELSILEETSECFLTI